MLITQSRGVFLGLAPFGGSGVRVTRIGEGDGRRGRAVAAPMILPAGWQRLNRVGGIGDTAELSQLDDQGSAEQRYKIWKIACPIIADHPVTGVGWGAYP